MQIDDDIAQQFRYNQICHGGAENGSGLAGIAVNALAAGGTGFFSYIARDP